MNEKEIKEAKDFAKWQEMEKNQKWYSWGSPIGLGLWFLLSLGSIGLFLLLLHLASIIK